MRRYRISLPSFVAALLAVTLCLPLGCAAEAALTDEQRLLCLDSFDQVWTTVRDRHWDPELAGLDWEAARDELRPRVEHAATRDAARAVMQELLERLGQSHFAIIPESLYDDFDPGGDAANHFGVTGIDARIVDGRALVTAVESDSPAADAGVRPGWEIVRIGEVALAPRLEAIAVEYDRFSWRDGVLAGSVLGRLTGEVGSRIEVECIDARGMTTVTSLERVEPKGRRISVANLPPLHVWSERRRLDGDVGYFAFNHFLDPMRVMARFNGFMDDSLAAPGIVLDIRGNGGGLPGMAMGMAGWLIEEQDLYLGTVYLRDTELKVIVNPRPRIYRGPVAILVDELSGSASEIFAGGLQDLGRARIFGRATAGAALPSAIERLPNGDGFQYAFATYVSQGGETLEGRGVRPDEPVVPRRDRLLAGGDPALDAALAWIAVQADADRAANLAR